MEINGIKITDRSSINANTIKIKNNYLPGTTGAENATASKPSEKLNSPTTAKKYLTDLQAKVDKKIAELTEEDEDYPEAEFFRKDLRKFLDGTVDPDDVALILFGVKVLSQKQREKIQAQSLDYEKNDIIYNAVTRTGGIAHLIKALHKTGNKRMLDLIEKIATSES